MVLQTIFPSGEIIPSAASKSCVTRVLTSMAMASIRQPLMLCRCCTRLRIMYYMMYRSTAPRQHLRDHSTIKPVTGHLHLHAGPKVIKAPALWQTPFLTLDMKTRHNDASTLKYAGTAATLFGIRVLAQHASLPVFAAHDLLQCGLRLSSGLPPWCQA